MAIFNLPRHDFTCWWGYTSLFNILDYPSITLPIKDLKISAEKDPKDMEYKPLDNPFDKLTYDMCKFFSFLLLFRVLRIMI